jgi:hypothetical protein
MCTGARTALRTITAPAQSKSYIITNATTGGFSVKIVGVGPTTGLTIVAGESAVVAWNGSDFIRVGNTAGVATFTNLTATGTLEVTGATTLSSALTYGGVALSNAVTGTGNMVLSTSPTLVTPALGTPSALVGTNITGTASGLSIGGNAATATTATNQSGGTINATTLTTSSTVTHNGGTANGVAYLNASKVLTTGSALTFDESTLSISCAGAINEARGSVAMHATTMDLWAQPNIIDGTGSAVTITAIANAPQAGARRVLYPITSTIITNGATFAVDGAADYTTAAGDKLEFEAITTSTYKVHITKKDGTAVASAGALTQIQPISASVGSSALTISASALNLEFRSTTLGSGAVTRVSGTPANLVISSGSTLGTVSAVQSDIAVLALNNAGTIELAAVNIKGGVDLSETGLISTAAEGGAGAADAEAVTYSTTARSSVAYRVLGIIRSTQATAGTWATAPSLIQGAGGQAITAMSSLGYGQTWQGVARSAGTTYYNTTGKPIIFRYVITANSSSTVTINGVAMGSGSTVSSQASLVTHIIPPGASYSYSGGSADIYELR